MHNLRNYNPIFFIKNVSMNHIDSISYLAQNNSTAYRPLLEEEVKDIKIPYFQVYKDSLGKYAVRMFNYEKHDNAPRMPHYCGHLVNRVFPMLDPSCDITGYYPIELHDSNSYLNNKIDYKNTFVFAKDKNDTDTTLLPDPYQIEQYGGRLGVIDNTSWNTKIDKIGFYGVTTGNTNPKENQRLKICQWSLGNRDISDFYITRVAQIEPMKILETYPAFKDMTHAPIPQHEQYRYKFLLDIDGNTNRWDIWHLNTKSLTFKHDTMDMLWYYPLLHPEMHYVDVNVYNMRQKYEYYINNQTIAEHIIYNANTFVKNFITPLNTLIYTKELFENISHNKH